MVSSVTGLTPPLAPPTFPWKRNIAVLWVAQIVATLGFSFTFPFFPLFFRDLGIDDVENAAFWTGLSGWALGLGMGLFSPFWGILGDRFGRRLNIVRAMALGGVVLGLTGYAQNPEQLVFARFLSGASSGVVMTIMALVAAHTPREHLPVATGAIQSSLFLGSALGPLIGGIAFDAYGMQAAFWATGGALLTAAVMVALFVQEEFQRPEHTEGMRNPLADLWRLASSRTFSPLLLMLVIVFMGHLVMMPVLPGMAELVAGTVVSATQTSILFMAIGIASAASSVGMGWLAGRVDPKQVFVIGAALAGLTSLGPFFAGSMVALTVTVAAASLFQGGLAGLTSGLIALRAPQRQHGAAFGAAQASQSLGVAFGPLLGGSVAVALGLRAVFLVNVGLFGVAAIAAVVLLASTTDSRAAAEESQAAG